MPFQLKFIIRSRLLSVLYTLISLLSLWFAAVLLTCMLAPRSRVEGALVFTVAWSTLIVLLGYALSEMNRLRSPGWWAAGSLLAGALIMMLPARYPRLRALCLQKVTLPHDVVQRMRTAGFRRFDTLLLLLALAGAMTIGALANFVVLIGLEPANIDAIYYHLPRVMY